MVRGQLEANGEVLSAGDALLLVYESALTLGHAQDAEVLVFDLAAHGAGTWSVDGRRGLSSIGRDRVPA